MIFIIKSTNANRDLAVYRAKKNAYMKLAVYQLGPTELQLSAYLIKNYKLNIKQACAKILQCSVFSLNLNNEIIVTIRDPILNKISQEITFGTGLLVGSHILKDMFTI